LKEEEHSRKGTETHVRRSGVGFLVLEFTTTGTRRTGFLLAHRTMIPDPSSRVQTQPPRLHLLLRDPLLDPFSLALGRVEGRAGEELGGVADEGAALGEDGEAANDGDGGGAVEASDVDEVAELKLVGADEVGVGVGDGDEGGVEGVGELEEVAAGLQGGGGGELRHDLRDLEEGLAVRGGYLAAGVLQKLGEDARSKGRHYGAV